MHERTKWKASIFQSLAESADVQLPEMPDEEFAPLTWETIKEMENNRIYFGSHTMNHEILTEMNSNQAFEEIMVEEIYRITPFT